MGAGAVTIDELVLFPHAVKVRLRNKSMLNVATKK